MKKSTIKLLGLIGKPLGHSLSPQIQNKWIKHYQLNYDYQLFPLESCDDLRGFIKKNAIHGLNVTLPYKTEVIEHLDQLDADAKAIGAVNTIKNENGKLSGYNTDMTGLDLTIGGRLKGNSKVLMLGAGGAAKAMAYLARKKGLRLDIYNRTEIKALQLAEQFNHSVVTLVDLYDQDYDVLINATSIGLRENESPLEWLNFSKSPKFVFDMIYNPPKTRLLAEAESSGSQIMNGYAMLYNQARESFRIWTGIFPE
ncbi:MAG: shikimate dehydrogenase [Calditrichaeota bacterium]|nr:shikimate dehydrogenase [Calditrichota bacterium]